MKAEKGREKKKMTPKEETRVGRSREKYEQSEVRSKRKTYGRGDEGREHVREVLRQTVLST